MVGSPLTGQPSQPDATSFRLGTIVRDSAGKLQVSVGGVILPARWADLVVAPNDAVLVVLVAGPKGQAEAIVMCRTAARPLPGTGVVSAVPAGSPTITVTTAEGPVVARFIGSYTPTLGDNVVLSWEASQATVQGTVGFIPSGEVVPNAPAPPPGGASAGTQVFPAIDSGTFEVGARWNATFGQDVVQGSYGGRTSTGAWFYGTAPSSLAGRSISGARIYLAPRRRMGNYNAAATIHIYAHNSPSRPEGEPSRVTGAHDVPLPPGFSGDWIPIPPAFAALVVAGGGIAIAGNPYAGILGRGNNPQSGALEITWAS